VSQYLESIDPRLVILQYGMSVPVGTPLHLLARVASSLQHLNPELVKDCGIRTLGFKDLGPSRELYPNHGLYVNDKLFLNSQLVDDPTIYEDTSSGKRLDTFDHILYHELGHGWDVQKGGGTELSLQPEWLGLSGWVNNPLPGKVKVIIQDKDELEPLEDHGWYYDPGSKFVRYYARWNPWDDFADTFSFLVAGMNGFLPEEKKAYFDDRMKDYL
jgi:hypothetical protein